MGNVYPTEEDCSDIFACEWVFKRNRFPKGSILFYIQLCFESYIDGQIKALYQMWKKRPKDRSPLVGCKKGMRFEKYSKN